MGLMSELMKLAGIRAAVAKKGGCLETLDALRHLGQQAKAAGLGTDVSSELSSWADIRRSHKKYQTNRVLEDASARADCLDISTAILTARDCQNQLDLLNNVARSWESAVSVAQQWLAEQRAIAFRQWMSDFSFESFYGGQPDTKTLLRGIDVVPEETVSGSQFGVSNEFSGVQRMQAQSSENFMEHRFRLLVLLAIPESTFLESVRKADPGTGISEADREKRLTHLESRIKEARATIQKVPSLRQVEIFASYLWLKSMNASSAAPCDCRGVMLEADSDVEALRTLGISWALTTGRLFMPTDKPRDAA